MPVSRRCVIHGSLRKHLRDMEDAFRIFRDANIEILAPSFGNITKEENGFLFFKGEERSDPRLIELLYLQNLRRLGDGGFSYFVNPGGYIGKSVAYELGIAHALGVPCFFTAPLADHPAYIPSQNIMSPEALVAYIKRHARLPGMQKSNPPSLEKLWKSLMVSGSVVAAGAIIEHVGRRSHDPDILFVRTHKWRNQFSIVGGKVRRSERLHEALHREVYEETGLSAQIGSHLCTFDQIKNSGYYEPSTHHLFVDYVVRVDRKYVVLNEEAQEYVWLPARYALTELPLEPNARHTLEIYAQSLQRA